MDVTVDDLSAERESCRSTVNALAVTRAWTFENSPSSADPVDDTYLKKVDECDLFILILGGDLTDAVENEYARAVAKDKRRLVFVKTCGRSARASDWLSQRHDVKWQSFESADDLADHVRAAVVDELIKSHRRLNLSVKDFDQIAVQLRSEPVSFMVRTITAGELKEVTEAFPQLVSRYPDFEEWVQTKSVDISKGAAVALVASYGSENAGFALVSEKGSGVRKISTLFIKTRYQAQGIGPRLLFGVIEQAARDAIEKLYITLDDDLRPTLEPLLSRFGFVVEGVSARRYGEGRWEWVWTKRLLHGRLRSAQLHRFVQRVMFEERGYAVEKVNTRTFKAMARYNVLGDPSPSTNATLVATSEGSDPVQPYKKASAKAQELGLPLVFVSMESLPLTPSYGLCLDGLDLEERFFPMYVEGRSEGLVVAIQEKFVQNLIPQSNQLQMVLPTRVQLRTDNVYYRYPNVFSALRRGSPIFFYETARKQGQSQLIGEGRLIEYAVDEPEDLLAKFGNLGVYTLGEVQRSTTKKGEHKGKALALHFDWYREASAPLTLTKIRTILPSFDPLTARRVQPNDALELRRLAGWNVDTLSLP
ncbi:MAG: GNAT family N-acetyltransferase [Chloroflexota bacterium]|nr:GNAT family N-acetyltransferase [Chloroflexota bacterium]